MESILKSFAYAACAILVIAAHAVAIIAVGSLWFYVIKDMLR